MNCMLYYPCYITRMARGESGRIVIEIEPQAKRQLYAALALAGSTLKDWFLKKATDFCADAAQPSLFSLPDRLPDKARFKPLTEGIKNGVKSGAQKQRNPRKRARSSVAS